MCPRCPLDVNETTRQGWISVDCAVANKIRKRNLEGGRESGDVSVAWKKDVWESIVGSDDGGGGALV